MVVRFLFMVAALTLVYCLTLASSNPWDVAFGAALAALLLVRSRRFVFAGEAQSPVARFFAFFPFAAVVIGQAIAGTIPVVAATLGLRRWPQGGVVEVPIGSRSPTGVAVWSVITGLPPGSYFVDVDERRGVALIHLFDASDPDGYRHRVAELYLRFQSKVFP